MIGRELREAPATRAGIPCYEITEWAQDLGLLAGITSRSANFALPPAASSRVPPEPWRSFRRTLRPRFRTMVLGRQCHGTGVAAHPSSGSAWRVLDRTDGHLTQHAGLLLGVTVADCVPVYLVQAGHPWVGLLHAGWRGIAAGIVEQGITRLIELATCRPADIVMHCGVSICGDCYEVGHEVFEAVTGRPASGRRQLDLRSAVVDRARQAGVERVTVSPWCSAHDGRTFHSHRRSRGTDGRMVAYLGRPSA